jgi:hypothetical protein
MNKFYLLIALIGSFNACVAPETNNKKEEKTEDAKTIAEPPTLSDAEKAAGFTFLFNGVNGEGWHVYKKDSFSGWEIANGVLSTKGGNGDLVTNAEYENFELLFDWQVSKGGNSGVFYMVQDDPKIPETYYTGIEYQLIDDLGWPDKLEEGQKSGAVYDLYPPTKAMAKPVGKWNSGRIVANKGHYEHYLNGEKVAEFDWNSPDYIKRLKASKFKDWPFAKKTKGHIAIQDHGQAVSLKNVKIKIL